MVEKTVRLDKSIDATKVDLNISSLINQMYA